jgi:hypothetical protein
MAVGREPPDLYRIGGDRTAVQGMFAGFRKLDNGEPPALVTIW